MQKGTGVATYTRGLIQTARQLDYKTGIVHSVRGKLPKDPALREVILFDDNSNRKLAPVAQAKRWLRRQIGAPLG
ncbi:hypothetical protein, partial [Providencia rettgeri]